MKGRTLFQCIIIATLHVFFFGHSARASNTFVQVRDTSITEIRDTSSILDSLYGLREKTKKSYFQASLTYENDNVYLGRKDSTAIPYLTPALGYYHKSGLYLQVSLGYLNEGSSSRIDEFSIEGGYVISKGNYDGQFNATKYYYSSLSTNINSEISGSLAFDNGYDLGLVRPSLNGTLNFGKKTDYILGFGIDHSFQAIDEKLEIDPKIAVNGGTQNFYNDYYKNRRYTVKRKGQKPIVGVAKVSGEVLNPDVFKILDYEGSVSLNYVVGKFTFNLTPTYAVPVNPSTIAITETLQSGIVLNKTHSEKLSNTLYWTVGGQFNF